MTNKENQNTEAASDNRNINPCLLERNSKGRFLRGNQIGLRAKRIGVSSLSIRRHRSVIGDHVDQLLGILIDEAINNKNIQIAMWLIDKIIPNAKSATFADTTLLRDIKTLTDLKDQSAQTIEDSIEGNTPLEEAKMLMDMYKEHKTLIEAADVEVLVEELIRN